MPSKRQSMGELPTAILLLIKELEMEWYYMKNNRNIILTNSDNASTIKVKITNLDNSLLSELHTVEKRTGKIVTGISLEMNKIKEGKPHNLGFSFGSIYG